MLLAAEGYSVFLAVYGIVIQFMEIYTKPVRFMFLAAACLTVIANYWFWASGFAAFVLRFVF
jgi:hypothetical protein